MQTVAMDPVFLVYCKACGCKHRMSQRPCPECAGRGDYTPQPVSDAVADACGADYACDGCRAYRDHANILR